MVNMIILRQWIMRDMTILRNKLKRHDHPNGVDLRDMIVPLGYTKCCDVFFRCHLPAGPGPEQVSNSRLS